MPLGGAAPDLSTSGGSHLWGKLFSRPALLLTAGAQGA
jgi:hypothetical protein